MTMPSPSSVQLVLSLALALDVLGQVAGLVPAGSAGVLAAAVVAALVVPLGSWALRRGLAH